MSTIENLQIEVPNTDELPQDFGVKLYEKKYHNQNPFIIGFDPNSEKAQARKQKRSERFGIKEDEIDKEALPTAEKRKKCNIGKFEDIDINDLKWPPVPDTLNEEIRHDALLLYGVDNMSTKDVFDYFQFYAPDTLEWIDDLTCNVVWLNEQEVSDTIEAMSKTHTTLKKMLKESPVIVKSEPVGDSSASEDEVVPIEDDVSPQDVWRIGKPYNGYQLFLRFATQKDKKLPKAAERSEYYLKYGRDPSATKKGPGILTNSRKRKLEQMKEMACTKYKDDSPAVKIIDIIEMKKEGIIKKNEVEIEPEVKRFSMSMVADQVELQRRLSAQSNTNSVLDRIGFSTNHEAVDEEDVFERSNEKSAGQKTNRPSIRDRLGLRENTAVNPDREIDARHEINTARNNRKKNKSRSYIDEYGDYHDVYFADDVTEEEIEREMKKYKNNAVENNNNDSRDNDSDMPSQQLDLRSKLNKNKKPSAAVKKEEEKMNLCIEIKQEDNESGMEVDDEDNFDF